MSSVLPGFEYDIFISYRQKDNKHDGWVTEFVDQLKDELESAFKEEITVYFDINIYDGLLETYDVDASLKNKLKCLVFIPIISRTYCDPRSFAWEHEFKAFADLASKDHYGLKIRLPNGNVACRVLPVRIHDLEEDDIKLCESILGGVLRGIDFIYNSAGVNRPLRVNEEHPHDNTNKSYYRDQINKVANAIKEIITALKNPIQQDKLSPYEVSKTNPIKSKFPKTKIILASFILLTLLSVGCFLIPKLFSPAKSSEKSIAVLPFKLLSEEIDKQYLADGTMDAILLHLQKFNDLRVMSRTSVEQYRGTTKTTHAIGQELNVEYLLEGSFQKSGDHVKLIVQLINAREERHVWANEYERNWTDIYAVQSEVAQTIAAELHTIVTPEEKKLIEKVPTANLTAYNLYMKANDFQNSYMSTKNLGSYQKAVTFYKAAIELDSAFAKAYTGLASTYYSRYYWETYFRENFLDSCLVLVNTALNIDDRLEEAYYLKGQYYSAIGNMDEALDNYDKALLINPNYYLAYLAKGYILTWVVQDFVKGVGNNQKALTLISGQEQPSLLRSLARAFLDVGFIEKSKYYYQEALKLDGDEALNLENLAWLELSLENFENALSLLKQLDKLDSTRYISLIYYSLPPGHNEEAYVKATKLEEYYKKSGALNLVQSHRIGYAFWKLGKFKEAMYYFNQQINYCKETIRLDRIHSKRKAAQYDLAVTYAFLNDKVKAYQYLEEFNKLKFYPLWWISLAKHDPMLSSLRNEERFKTIMQNMESKFQAEHERVREWLENQKN